MPQVTVVVPAYNAEATLAETLESLLAQTFKDFEAIVVDDGSVDGTVGVAQSFGDPRLRTVSIPNGGVSRARNRAITQAQGEFVAFLDADDLWDSRKLELQTGALSERGDAGWSVTGGVRIDAASREIGTLPLLHADDVCRALLLHSMTVGHLSSGMARKSLLDAVGGFDESLSQCADWDLWLRMSVAAPLVIVDQKLLRYRTTPGNMSSNIGLLEHDTFAVLDKFFASPESSAYRDIRNRVYGTHWTICAGSYLHARAYRDSVRALLSGFRVAPASIARALSLPWRRLSRTVRVNRRTA
jgi:glycosyltransferase involved in cell wall biosynthesis